MYLLIGTGFPPLYIVWMFLIGQWTIINRNWYWNCGQRYLSNRAEINCNPIYSTSLYTGGCFNRIAACFCWSIFHKSSCVSGHNSNVMGINAIWHFYPKVWRGQPMHLLFPASLRQWSLFGWCVTKYEHQFLWQICISSHEISLFWDDLAILRVENDYSIHLFP